MASQFKLSVALLALVAITGAAAYGPFGLGLEGKG